MLPSPPRPQSTPAAPPVIFTTCINTGEQRFSIQESQEDLEVEQDFNLLRHLGIEVIDEKKYLSSLFSGSELLESREDAGGKRALSTISVGLPGNKKYKEEEGDTKTDVRGTSKTERYEDMVLETDQDHSQTLHSKLYRTWRGCIIAQIWPQTS